MTVLIGCLRISHVAIEISDHEVVLYVRGYTGPGPLASMGGVPLEGEQMNFDDAVELGIQCSTPMPPPPTADPLDACGTRP